MRKTLFIKNTIVLTASSIILRFIGIIFKVWLSTVINSEGIGLYQVIFSIFMLISTFATSGICTAVTRLISEENAKGNYFSSGRILKSSILLSILIALLSGFAIFFGADFISKKILNDARAALSLKVLPFTLPFMAVSSCIRGFFFANRKITANSVITILEQIIRIAFVSIFIIKLKTLNIGICCAIIMLGDLVAEAFAGITLSITYLKSRIRIRGKTKEKFYRKIIKIALPITSGRYLNSGLRTWENILVPKNLAKYALSSKNALSQFGMIKGMALPVLFFPSALLNSVSVLLIPEISEAMAKKQKYILKTATEKILKITILTGFIFAAIFFIAGESIGFLIYKDKTVGSLIKALAPIVPFMYIDSIADGILKGLDEQNFCFKISILDSALRIILILLILPFMGLKGFILIMYFSNFLTAFKNFKKLEEKTMISFNKNKTFLSILLAFLTVSLCDILLKLLNIQNILVYIIFLSILSSFLYIGSLFIFNIIDKNFLRDLIS